MRKKFVAVLLCLSLVGLGLSGYLTRQYYELRLGKSTSSACDFTAEISCTSIIKSDAASLGNIPYSGLGFLYYLLILIHCFIALPQKNPCKAGLMFCFYLSILSLLITAFKAYLMFVVLHGLCPFCLGMYAVNILLFLFLPLALNIPFAQLPKTIKNYYGAIMKNSTELGFKPYFFRNSVLFSTVFLMGMILLNNWSNASAQQKDEEKNTPPKDGVQWVKDAPKLSLDDIIKMHMAQPQAAINIEGSPMKGNAQAKVVLVEFSDFECPYCSKAAAYFNEFMKKHPEDIAFYHRQYPLDKSCNPNIKNEMHKVACSAAKAALCAQQKDLYWPMHDSIFQNQKTLSEENLLVLAKGLGMDEAWFKTCLASAEVEQKLMKDIEDAQKLQISGTPSVFLNGRKVQLWTEPSFLEALVAKEKGE